MLSLSPIEVRDVLLSLDPYKATGPDKIPAKLLKVCAPHLYSSLCALFNKCLLLGKMPSSWQESNIVPLLKGGTVKEDRTIDPSHFCLLSQKLSNAALMLSTLTSPKPSTGLSTSYWSRRSTDSTSAVPCCFGSKTILLTASKGSPFSGPTLNLSLCYQVYRKDQYLVHSRSSYM